MEDCKRTTHWKKREELRAIYRYLTYEYVRFFHTKSIHAIKMAEKDLLPQIHDNVAAAKCKKETIYILVSPHSQKYYIGRTMNPRLREYQHINDAKKCVTNTASKSQRTYAHEFMGRTQPESWVMIPIMSNIDHENIVRLERNIIKRFSPALNTQYVKDHYKKIPNSFYAYAHKNPVNTTHWRSVKTIKRPHRQRKKARIRKSDETKPIIKAGTTMYELSRYDTTQPTELTHREKSRDLVYLINKVNKQYKDEKIKIHKYTTKSPGKENRKILPSLNIWFSYTDNA